MLVCMFWLILKEVWRLGFLDKKSQKWYNKKSIIL